MRHKPDSTRIRLLRILLDGQEHTAFGLMDDASIGMTTMYNSLRRMTDDGWLDRRPGPGGRRIYQATACGLRAMRYLVELADQPEDGSRSSSPTASRNSS